MCQTLIWWPECAAILYVRSFFLGGGGGGGGEERSVFVRSFFRRMGGRSVFRLLSGQLRSTFFASKLRKRLPRRLLICFPLGLRTWIGCFEGG